MDKHIMKKTIYALLAFVMCSAMGMTALGADDGHDKGSRKFCFVYIAHDVNTPKQRLIDRLKMHQNEAYEEGEDVIFYLASGDDPIVVEYNVGKDNKEAFDEVLVGEINERISHDVDAIGDVERILELIDKADIMDENRNLKYYSVEFDFFVNPKFWTLGNNETVIGQLYYALDVPKVQGSPIKFMLYEAKEDRVSYPEGKPFGDMNPDGINQAVATNKIYY